jgi:hypothetical protein
VAVVVVVAGTAGGTVVLVVTGGRLLSARAVDGVSVVAVNSPLLVIAVSFDAAAAWEVEDVRSVLVGVFGAFPAAVAVATAGPEWRHSVKATVPDPPMATSSPRHVANAPPRSSALETAALNPIVPTPQLSDFWMNNCPLPAPWATLVPQGSPHSMPLGHRASYISAAVNLKLIIVGIGIHVNNDGGTGDHRNPLATGEQFTEPCPDSAACVRRTSR